MPPVVRLLPLLVLAGCGPNPAPPAAAPAVPANLPAVAVVVDIPADAKAICSAVDADDSTAVRTYRRDSPLDLRMTVQPLGESVPARRAAFGDQAPDYRVRFSPLDAEGGTVTMAETVGGLAESKTLTIAEGVWEDLDRGGRVVLLGAEREDGGESLREAFAAAAAHAVRATAPDSMPVDGSSAVTIGGDDRQRVVLTAERAEIGYAGELWASVVVWERRAAAEPQPTNSATTRTVPSANRTR